MNKSTPAKWQRDITAANKALAAKTGAKGSNKSVFGTSFLYFGIGEDPFANAVGIGKVDAPPGWDVNIGWASPIGVGLFGTGTDIAWATPVGEALDDAANAAGS